MHLISLSQVLILDFPHKAENRWIILTISDCNYIITASALPSDMTQPPEQTTQCKGDAVLVISGGCCLYCLAALLFMNPPLPIVWSRTIIWTDWREISSSPKSRFLLWQRSSSGTCRLKPCSTFSYYFKEISLQQRREECQPERG